MRRRARSEISRDARARWAAVSFRASESSRSSWGIFTTWVRSQAASSSARCVPWPKCSRARRKRVSACFSQSPSVTGGEATSTQELQQHAPIDLAQGIDRRELDVLVQLVDRGVDRAEL